MPHHLDVVPSKDHPEKGEVWKLPGGWMDTSRDDSTLRTLRREIGEEWGEEGMELLAKEYSIPFYDFEQPGSLACDYFADTSHLSKSCFPEVVEKILLEGTNKNRTDLR
jgi:hypothetical protein